jgi:hypothetical protein
LGSTPACLRNRILGKPARPDSSTFRPLAKTSDSPLRHSQVRQRTARTGHSRFYREGHRCHRMYEAQPGKESLFLDTANPACDKILILAYNSSPPATNTSTCGGQRVRRPVTHPTGRDIGKLVDATKIQGRGRSRWVRPSHMNSEDGRSDLRGFVSADAWHRAVRTQTPIPVHMKSTSWTCDF